MNLESYSDRFSPALIAFAQERLSEIERFRGVDLPQPGTAGEAALESMGMGQERDALEAIIWRMGRPALLVENDHILLEPLPDFPDGTDLLIKGVERWIPSAGRIDLVNSDYHYGGTGWIANRINDHTALIVTNRHVAKLFARRERDGRGSFVRSWNGARISASIDFLAEAGTRARDRVATIREVIYLAEDIAADVALLKIESPDAFIMPQALKLGTGRPRKHDLVGLIGYPGFDSRNNAADQSRYFKDLYEVKRFSPGKVMQDVDDHALLSHDCTSLGGASGGALLSLETGEVVGLHFSGVEGRANSAVTAPTLAALLAGQRPYTVSSAMAPDEGEGLADGFHPASHFAGRTGFDTGFLNVRATPWPRLRDDLGVDLAVPSDDPAEAHELRYTHFGVKFHAGLRLPLLTAVNIDGSRAVRIKRGRDKWFADGRLPTEIQLNRSHFADPEIDRGHMVRREDPNWGPVDAGADAQAGEARLADADTFHYVNSAPQHARLNQGKTLWQGLENYILDSARTHGFRASVFTGPVIPSGRALMEIDGVLIPDDFWKLVVTLDAAGTGLHATAYVLTQGEMLRELMEKRSRRESLEGFTLGNYRSFQVAVRDLAEATGHDFSHYVAFDPLETGAESLMDPAAPRVLPLRTLDDLVL